MDPSFPSNSHNVLGKTAEPPKQKVKEEKVVEKVVTTNAVKRRVPIGRKLKMIFFGGEVKGAASYIGMDVLLPAFRNMVVDATTKGVERVIYGGAPPRRFDQNRPRVSYNSPVDRGYSRSRPAMLPDQPPLGARQRRHEAGEVYLVSREEAELVLERLSDIIEKYDVASVADLADLCGLPHVYTDNNWGWQALRGAGVRQTRDGYLLDLPPVEQIQQ